ncbi:hypothetical protein C8J56DRAFT_1057588 [Mycena floridula]|nr:hypothetical protein C8J56DRAFT_1057588 [Mycena floridula]
MIFHNLSVSLFLSLLARVVAHGPGAQVTLDGHAFPGNLPAGSQPVASVVRLVSSGDSKKGATDPYIDCGNDAQAATAVAPATPGSVLAFKWTGESDQVNWFHNTGPMLTYLASGGETTCDNSTWLVPNVDRSPATATLSTNLAAGNYLVHHEVIALHNALSIDGAEFYPSQLLSFPDASSDQDTGIYVPQVSMNPTHFVCFHSQFYHWVDVEFSSRTLLLQRHVLSAETRTFGSSSFTKAPSV